MTLLAIGVPTYRRAGKFDRQLAWLHRNIAGHEAECEVILSDNASPDATPEVCRKWADTFTAMGVKVTVRRNDRNVGPLPNIAQCLRLSRARFTWVIGDDDDIDEGTFDWLLTTLRNDPDLASIVLNYRTEGKDVNERCYRFDADTRAAGKTIFEECYRQRGWGLGFMTAQVYRTEYVQNALRAWPDGLRNYDYQTWVTVYTGMQGQVLITRDPRVTYVTGDSIYVANKKAAMSMYADEVEILTRLRKAGLSPQLLRDVARHHLWENKGKLARTAMHVNLLLTLTTVARVSSYMLAI